MIMERTSIQTWERLLDFGRAASYIFYYFGYIIHTRQSLGADVYPYILLDGLIKGAPGTPIAQRTIFGWTLTGPVSMGKNVTTLILLSSHISVISKSSVFVPSRF